MLNYLNLYKKYSCLTILLVALSFSPSLAQKCDCVQNFNWVKTTFEQNDAGFEFALKRKGKDAYEAHNKKILQKVKTAATLVTCREVLAEWLSFFRNGHISIGIVNNAGSNTAVNSGKPLNWDSLSINMDEFKHYLSSKKVHDYEGIWEFTPYTVGIIKKQGNYIGFIVDSDVPAWTKGLVKLKIVHQADGKDSCVKFLRNFSPDPTNDVSAIGNNCLVLGNTTLKRIFPADVQDSPEITNYTKILGAAIPYLEKYNENTVFLRIPSFNESYKKAIDSILQANHALITRTENLIIDIRNNGGGSDRSYYEILPYLYTNPIRVVGMALYATKLNNQRMLTFMNNPNFASNDEERKEYKDAYDTLQKHLGEFYNFDKSKISITKLDTVYTYPRNIGIIINKGNGSTAEQFLLAAKQSKKVKLFGTTTEGVLDISNMYFVQSPGKEFELGYCLSKTYRIPDFEIDNKGIAPDYYLDSEIPKWKWVDYVNEVLNNK